MLRRLEDGVCFLFLGKGKRGCTRDDLSRDYILRIGIYVSIYDVCLYEIGHGCECEALEE